MYEIVQLIYMNNKIIFKKDRNFEKNSSRWEGLDGSLEQLQMSMHPFPSQMKMIHLTGPQHNIEI